MGRTVALFALSVVVATWTATACSSETGGIAEGGGARGSDASGGGSGGGAGQGQSASSGEAGTGSFIESGIGLDMALTEDSACAQETQKGERIVVAMYIMLDQSGSMNQESPSRWSQALTSMTAFVNDPLSTGLKVAVQSFSGEGPCDGSIYNTPAVAMDLLPMNALPITTWMSGVVPNGNTPTQGALLGLTSFTGTYAAANPKERVIGLLITDGVPTTCDTSGATLVGIAQSAFASGGLVFTMGMTGADFALMNQIAAAGGTTTAFDASSGAASFQAALEAIRGIALSCEFSIPQSTTGQPLDFDEITVAFTPSDGSADQLVGKVANEAACAGVAWGWYYDDPITPTTIVLCPDTCTSAKMDPTGQIGIILGCTSLPPV